MRIGDVIRDESPDTDLNFYCIVTQLPDKNGHYEGIQVAIDRKLGIFHSVSSSTSGNINKLDLNERLLAEAGDGNH